MDTKVLYTVRKKVLIGSLNDSVAMVAMVEKGGRERGDFERTKSPGRMAAGMRLVRVYLK